jgi:hypothetical protein
MTGANINLEKILPWAAVLSSFSFIAFLVLFG